MQLTNFKLGATGDYPRGKVDPTDEGELRIAMAADHNHAIVRLVFGKAITWIGLPATDARAIGQLLIEKADELDARKT